MKAHLHEEFKLWSFVVLCQSQSRMQGGKKEKSNMKNSRGQQLLDTFLVLPGVHFMHTISCFKAQEVRSPTPNGARIWVETKKLWPFEDNRIKLCENFAAAKWAAKFRSPCLHLRSCEPRCGIISKLQNHLQVVESPPSCKIKIQNCKMATCESPCEIHLCKLRYLQPT